MEWGCGCSNEVQVGDTFWSKPRWYCAYTASRLFDDSARDKYFLYIIDRHQRKDCCDRFCQNLYGLVDYT